MAVGQHDNGQRAVALFYVGERFESGSIRLVILKTNDPWRPVADGGQDIGDAIDPKPLVDLWQAGVQVRLTRRGSKVDPENASCRHVPLLNRQIPTPPAQERGCQKSGCAA